MKIAMFRTSLATLCFTVMATIAWGDEIVVEQANQILELAREEGHKIIAICPRPLIRAADGKDSFVGEVGASAVQQLAEFERILFERAKSFGIQIADPQTVSQALAGIRISDLGSFDVKKEIAQKTNASALTVMVAFEAAKGQWESRFELRNLVTNTSNRSQSAEYRISLSEAAYMGASFEVRRWVDGKLVNVGLEGLNEKDAMGSDYNWEIFQFARVKPPERHPLLDPTLPYRIELLVNGKSVTPIEVEQELAVGLDAEDQLQIRMVNKLKDKTILMGLYVDGINTINKKRELPFTTPYQRHWVLAPGYVGNLNGWLNYDPSRNMQAYTQFKLVDAEQSVAGLQEPGDVDATLVSYGSSIHDRIGQITAVVYTYGWDGINRNNDPGPGLKTIDGRFGIGEGSRQDQETEMVQGERGLLMGALTIRYLSKDQLNRMLAARSTVHADTQSANPNGTATKMPNKTPEKVESPIERGPKREKTSEAEAFPTTPDERKAN